MAQNDADFLKLSPADQKAYMVETDPDFSKLSESDQKAYLDFRTGGAYSRPAAMVGKPGPIAANPFARIEAMGAHAAQNAPILNPFHGKLTGEQEVERKNFNRMAADTARTVVEAEIGSELLGEGLTQLPQPMKDFAGRVGRTAMRAMGDIDITKPFKAISKLPDIWESTSPESLSMEETNAAVRKGLAAKIPTAGPRSVGAQAGKSAEPLMKAPGGSKLIPESVKPGTDIGGSAFSETKGGLKNRLMGGGETPEGIKIGQARGIVKPGDIVVPKEAQVATEGPRERVLLLDETGKPYPKSVSGGNYEGPERRLVQSPVAIEQRAREIGMHRIGPFQDTEGAMNTIMRDPDMPRYPSSMTGGHAGGGAASEEELSRPGTNYVVGKTGVTAHGKSFAPESIGEGQTHVTHLGNGQYRVNAGPDLTTEQQGKLATALGVDKVEAQR